MTRHDEKTENRRLREELVGARLAGRFRVERQLGRGGMGVVYEAYDEQRGEHVALKTLGTLDADAIYRLKREFRSVADLVHPNLVRLHELFNEGALWFFTMERIVGVPFLAAVRDVPVAPDETITATGELTRGAPRASATPSADTVREAELRACLSQLVAAVGAIHGAGRLHCDLKPSNVLVDADGRLVVLDFGLATDAAAGERTGGTPAYMAPEQLEAGGACTASDWYAVGVMLFEALTGRWPYTRNVEEVLAAKSDRRSPPDPRAFSPSAPADLATLAQSLLAPRAADRPDAKTIAAIAGAGPAPAGRGSTAFVDREAELAQMCEAFEAVRGGKPQVLAVSGVSGMGKTALIERFLDRVKTTLAPRAVILSARCHERETVPFKALDEAFDALSRHLLQLDPDTVAQLTPQGAPELCRVLPVLGRVPALAAAGETTETAPDALRERAISALRDLLAGLAGLAPLIVSVDDLQWGDADSRQLLTRLVLPPDPPAVLLIGAFRIRARRDPPVRAPGLLSTITLEPLPTESATALALQLLADREEPERSRVARAIAEESGGNPHFVVELARAHLGPHPPASLAALLTERIAALAPDARALLEVVAVAGKSLPRATALRAAGLPATADAAIPALVAHSLLRGTGERIEIYHDRIAEIAVAALSPERRREIQAALYVDPAKPGAA